MLGIGYEVKLGLFLGMELANVLVMLVLRPFMHVRDSVVAALNSVVMLFSISVLFWYDSYDQWSSAFTYVYLGVIMANAWLVSLIAFSKYFSWDCLVN